MISARIYEICKQEDFNEVIIEMEPTGHYWKACKFSAKACKNHSCSYESIPYEKCKGTG